MSFIVPAGRRRRCRRRRCRHRRCRRCRRRRCRRRHCRRRRSRSSIELLLSKIVVFMTYALAKALFDFLFTEQPQLMLFKALIYLTLR